MLFKFLNLRNRLKPISSKCCSCEDLLLSNCVQVKLVCIKSLFVGFYQKCEIETSLDFLSATDIAAPLFLPVSMSGMS